MRYISLIVDFERVGIPGQSLQARVVGRVARTGWMPVPTLPARRRGRRSLPPEGLAGRSLEGWNPHMFCLQVQLADARHVHHWCPQHAPVPARENVTTGLDLDATPPVQTEGCV
jgi:hypothetical protein